MDNRQLAELCGEVIAEAQSLRDFLAGDPKVGFVLRLGLGSYLRTARAELGHAAKAVADSHPEPAEAGRAG